MSEVCTANAENLPVPREFAPTDSSDAPGKPGRFPLAFAPHVGARWVAVLVLLTVAGSVAGAEEDVAGLIRQLREGDETGRASAAQRLGSLGPEACDAVPALMAALDDKANVRLAAAQALGKIGPDAAPAARTLAGMLPYEGDFRIIARALADIGPASVPHLRNLLPHEKTDVRVAAIDALGWIGPAAAPAAKDLIALLRDKDQAVRTAAAGAVRRVAPAAPECAPLLVELLGAEEEMIRWTAVETLAEMGKGAVSALAGALDAEQMEVRLYAVKALGKSKAPAELVIPLLVSALADSYWGVRQDAVMWLGRFGPAAQPAIPALLEAFTDKDTRVPHAAGDAVLDIDPTALGQALSHPKAAVRAYACYWPANWGPQGVVFVPQMLKLLKEDPDAQVRYRAARGLEHFPSKAAQIVPGLIAALEDENGHVRAGVCIALRQFGPEAVVAVPALIDTHRRHAKPFYLQNPFQKIVHVPSIQTDTGRPATALRKLAPYAVPGMVKNLASGDPAKQRRAAELLSVLGEPATPAVPLLTRLLPEADEVTRRNILDALINLGPVASPALGELMKLLEHQDPEVRVRVLMALRAIGSGARQAVPKTILLLDDKSNSVRCHALVTLAKVADPDVSVGHLAAALTHRGRFHITARQAVVPTLHLHLDHTAEHVPKLAQALSDGDSAFVSSIIQVLGDLGPRATEAVPALRRVAAKPDHPSLSNAAKEALARVEASK